MTDETAVRAIAPAIAGLEEHAEGSPEKALSLTASMRARYEALVHTFRADALPDEPSVVLAAVSEPAGNPNFSVPVALPSDAHRQISRALSLIDTDTDDDE